MPLLIITSFLCLPPYSFCFPSQLFLCHKPSHSKSTLPMSSVALFFKLGMLVELYHEIGAILEGSLLALSSQCCSSFSRPLENSPYILS